MKFLNSQYAPVLPADTTAVHVVSVLLLLSTTRPSDAVHVELAITSAGDERAILSAQVIVSCLTAVDVLGSVVMLMVYPMRYVYGLDLVLYVCVIWHQHCVCVLIELIQVLL
jgi:hypothetical protein